MIKKRFRIFIGVIVIITISVLAFIKTNNDHEECNTIVVHATGKNDNDITIEKHICKEKYNFQPT